VLENTPFHAPDSYVSAASFQTLSQWLATMPEERQVVVKPHTCSLSRGVRIVSRQGLQFQNGNVRGYNLKELLAEIASDLPKIQTAFKWLVEEYIYPPPPVLADLRPDGLFNPLARNVMVNGKFHFGELHIPTIASKGRGTLKGGAKRICYNWQGEMQAVMPSIEGEPPWNALNYGVGVDVVGRKLPNFDWVRGQLEEIALILCPAKMFSIDGCFNESGEFVVVEIEARPNVKHLIPFKGLRKPE
jgi:hypothetical protein